jgi:hypothetical protein
VPLGPLLVVLATGCGPTALGPGPNDLPDQPVPPSEPRAELRLEVDLQPAGDCEEAFDLGVYQDRGIELVSWDDDEGSCEGRVITVRYLSQKLDERAVRALVGTHAAAVRPAPSSAPGAEAPAAAPSESNAPSPE